MSEQSIRVLLADDHAMVRRGLRTLVEMMQGWSVCGEARTGREAVELARELAPEIVIMDMSMPVLNGLEATRQIRKLSPQTEVLIFTGHETEALVHQAFEAGARSYILKTAGNEQLEAALRALAAHKPYFTTEVGEILFARFLQEKKPGDEETSRLTTREREIVQLLGEGASNKEVSAALGISIKTAETHRAAIMKKLGFSAFSELIRYAIRNHIISS